MGQVKFLLEFLFSSLNKLVLVIYTWVLGLFDVFGGSQPLISMCPLLF
jgi:hypothetical protein